MYCITHRRKIECFFSYSKQILDPLNPVGPRDQKKSPNQQNLFKNTEFKVLKHRKNSNLKLEFPKICNFQLSQYGS